MRAIVNYYNPKRQFGFLATPEGDKYFFHISNFESGFNPMLGAEVEFQIGPPIALGKPPQAVLVRYPNPKNTAVQTSSEVEQS